MHLDRALDIADTPSLMAFLDYTHQHLYRDIGGFELGIDENYDEIAYALAFVSVEMVFADDLLEFKQANRPSNSAAPRRRGL
jgi:hypothetical protein